MTDGLSPALLNFVNIGPAGPLPEVLDQALQPVARALGDDFYGTAIGQVADVPGQPQRRRLPLDEVAVPDALDTSTRERLKALDSAVTRHLTPDT